MSTSWNSCYLDTDDDELEEVERILFRRSSFDETECTWDSSFSTTTTSINDISFWSRCSIDDVDTSIATSVGEEDFKIPSLKSELSAPGFGFLKSTEECLEEVARAVKTIQNSSRLYQLDRPRISHVRSSGFTLRSSSRRLPVHPYSRDRPKHPLYWKYDKFGDLKYAGVPTHLSHFQQVGNQWTYSLTGPWYPRSDPLIGDVHFSPSEVAGFDYWVYAMVGNEGVWCLTQLAQPHPLSSELVLQHLSVDSPPQWALSWDDLDVKSVYTS